MTDREKKEIYEAAYIDRMFMLKREYQGIRFLLMMLGLFYVVADIVIISAVMRNPSVIGIISTVVLNVMALIALIYEIKRGPLTEIRCEMHKLKEQFARFADIENQTWEDCDIKIDTIVTVQIGNGTIEYNEDDIDYILHNTKESEDKTHNDILE